MPLDHSGAREFAPDVRRASDDGDAVRAGLRVRIVVDVSAHQLTLYRAGRVVLRSPAAIGKPSTPTTLGTFFVTQRFVVDPPTGAYGPRALGISAFSNVLRAWRDGGPIGIHGTDETFSIGKPVSHGCVRLPNDLIIKLFAVTPLHAGRHRTLTLTPIVRRGTIVRPRSSRGRLRVLSHSGYPQLIPWSDAV